MSTARTLAAAFVVALGTLAAEQAHAYIGPGAGFAFVGSLAVLLVTFAIAFAIILTWPLRLAYRLITVGDPYKNAKAKRVVILGLDGMDPGLLTKFIRDGRMPNFQKLAEQGVFRPLDTSVPSMSPVAWSTFATGVDASAHGIYDFLTRDPCTYGPMLSSTDIVAAKKVVNIGRYVIPLGKARMKLLQKSQHFWKLLGEKNIFSIIQRVPITFPPVPFKNGMLLSGMCVPDLRGSQGTFSFFSTETNDGEAKFVGGEQTVLRPNRQGKIRSRIVGPDNSMLKSGGRMTLPFGLEPAADGKSAVLAIDGQEPITLPLGEYTDWIELPFDAAPTVTVRGIAKFYLVSLEPEVNLYMTPIHIDPENPAMPISHPEVYAIYLAKKQGKFATLGLAEDTWALNNRVVTEKVFYDQAMSIYEERERMFLDAIEQSKQGLITTVFDTTDRIQHMFYRYLDPDHPANAGKDTEEWKDAIGQVYEKVDGLLGKVWHLVDDPNTAFMVISDHGFTNFRRCVNVNSWLRDNGYLYLKDEEAFESGEYLEGVDWSRTRAFALGLTGVFVNRKGRERSGIVEEGSEYRKLVQEIAEKLGQLVDPQTGQGCVRRVAVSQQFFSGPYRFDAPDLLVGWEGGYRHSWECAVGQVTRDVFSDNDRSWSGDHCVDPSIVPGVFLSNRTLAEENPRLIDIPASVLRLFGQEIPGYMQGQMIFPEDGAEGTTKGMLDPTSLPQSGAAPGALIFPERAETSPRRASGES
ncbi:MAG: alkaline phosphatase family protein [Myxococcota bacterium]|nr:alkaline phosphatase family protein [Myxococcota bacterium]